MVGKKFSQYVQDVIQRPLSEKYKLTQFTLTAPSFRIPQVRKRVFFVGFRDEQIAANYQPPQPSHYSHHLPTTKSASPVQLDVFSLLEGTESLQPCMGVREALGLPDIGFDALSPTIRSSFPDRD